MDVGCLVVPRFPLACEIQARPQLGARPLAMARQRQAVLLVVSEEAERWGIYAGQSVSEALGRCPELEILDPRPVLYGEIAEQMVANLEAVAPTVEPAAEGICYIDLRGLIAHHGSADALPRALLGTLPPGLQPRLGVGPSKFSSWVAATDAPPGDLLVVTDAGAAAAFLANHSIAVLPVDDETARRLRLLGLETLGDVAALPASALVAQFGAAGSLLHSLARGLDDERIHPRAFREDVIETLDLEAPLSTAEPIVIAVEHLVARACHSSAFRGRASRQTTITLSTDERRRWQRTVTFKEALSDARRISTMVRAPLLAAQLPGPVTAITLELNGLVWSAGWQVQLLDEQAERRIELDEGLRKLRAQFGFCPVAHVVEVEPWNRIPERRQALSNLIS